MRGTAGVAEMFSYASCNHSLAGREAQIRGLITCKLQTFPGGLDHSNYRAILTKIKVAAGISWNINVIY